MQAVVRTNARYDFSRFDDRTSTRARKNPENAKTKNGSKNSRPSNEKPIISSFAVLSFTACIAILLVTLFSYVQLTELSDATVKLESRLEELREENQLLEIENGRKFSSEKIKEEAVGRLGMQKLDKSQITYLDMGSGNRVEIPEGTQFMRDSQVVAGIVNGFRWIVEYIN